MIEIDELHKALGVRKVLRGVSLRVEPGEVVALVGASGTGKSVLLKHVSGLLEPDRGDVRIGSRSIVQANYATLQSIRLGMGYVFQDAALLDSLTLEENLRLALPDAEYRGAPRQARARITNALELVNLDIELLSRMPRELSGGMRKRAGVARAIINQPRVILYDEPATGLDPRNVGVIDDLILSLRARLGATSLVVTHDMSSVRRIADRVVLLRTGQIEFAGPPAEFFAAVTPAVRNFIDPAAQEAT